MFGLVILLVAGGRAVVAQPEDGRVTRVVDGDTIHVSVDGRDETVRLIGIDTPEVGECGFRAASRALGELAAGRRVELVADGSQDERDRYGRLLAYVDRGDLDLGETMLRRGWAEVYVFDRAFERLGRYREAASAGARRGAAARCS
ncbi:MAG: micrococcal nuclease [Solirubrobacteraceae bacterium]|nr:micrococcal nuclease [Solirubrobacteraceae bacterium]